jgi:gamma-aminobutyric acid type B receptor
MIVHYIVLLPMQISYTSDALRGYIYNQSDVQVRYRFTTAASSSFLNKVRLKLLNDFNWRRIAVFSTDDAHNAQMAVDFVKLCKQNDSLDVFFPGTIHDDPSAIYRLLLSDDRRIIVAFFPMEYFRYFICKAIKFGLMTDKHVWILPGIYDYQWWYNCTCDDITTTICSCNECDETEILDAIQGTIFVDSAKHNSNRTANGQTSADNNNYSINEVFEQLIEVYSREEDANTFSDSDCQYFLHSNRLNAFDAAFLWGLAWHEAVYQILNSSTNATETCGTLRRPTNSYTGISRVTDLMANILTESIYCGYSGCYHFNYDNDYDLSQAMITQFYGESECVIGHYRNYNITAFDDYFDFKLHPFNVSYLLNSTVPILFDNTSTSSCLSIDNTSNVTCPYRWKGINDTLSWIAPVDGSCWDEDCRCYNKLEEWEAILSLVVMVTGITVSLILLVINWILKKNKY